MIAREIRSRDLQISQQLKEIERYRLERKQNLCGFCQKKMDSCRSQSGDRGVTNVELRRSIEVQTEEVTGFKGVMRLNGGKGENTKKAATEEELAPDDDWYANGNSDNENEKGQSPVNLYERGVNPVLERVNQVRGKERNGRKRGEMSHPESICYSIVHTGGMTFDMIIMGDLIHYGGDHVEFLTKCSRQTLSPGV